MNVTPSPSTKKKLVVPGDNSTFACQIFEANL